MGIVLLIVGGAVLVQAAHTLISHHPSMHEVNVFLGEFICISVVLYLGLRFYQRGSQNRP